MPRQPAPTPNDRETPINRRVSVSGQVFISIRRDIVTGALQPGTQLSEQKLSQRFGVSRTPIREAMLRLSDEGLVAIFPQVGTFVPKIAVSKVREAQFIREALECAAARTAAERATDEDKAVLEEIMRSQRRCDDNSDYENFYLFDEALHSAIATASGFPRIWTIALAEKVHLDRVRFLDMNNAADLGALITQHQAIVDAIIAHDEKLAETAARTHLRDVFRSIEGLIASHASFFETEPSTTPSPPRARRKPRRMPQ